VSGGTEDVLMGQRREDADDEMVRRMEARRQAQPERRKRAQQRVDERKDDQGDCHRGSEGWRLSSSSASSARWTVSAGMTA
jgi:hypothetical protein